VIDQVMAGALTAKMLTAGKMIGSVVTQHDVTLLIKWSTHSAAATTCIGTV